MTYKNNCIMIYCKSRGRPRRFPLNLRTMNTGTVPRRREAGKHKMIELYHGSPFKFDYPDVSRGKMYRDFGVGFYMAENQNDALSIALKESYDGYLYTYEVDDDALFRDLAVVEFDGFDDEWLQFVFNCRMDGSQDSYDVVIGQTAGGRVNDLFSRYRGDGIEFSDRVASEMSRQITDTRFGIQWCFASQVALDYAELVEVEELSR